MFNPGINDPGPWQWFVRRTDNVGIPLMEQRRKYMQEQLLFEDYISTLNTVNTVNSSVASSAAAGGGPAPGGGGPDVTPAKEILAENGDAILAEDGLYLVTE